jgi:hypothetical protein
MRGACALMRDRVKSLKNETELNRLVLLLSLRARGSATSKYGISLVKALRYGVIKKSLAKSAKAIWPSLRSLSEKPKKSKKEALKKNLEKSRQEKFWPAFARTRCKADARANSGHLFHHLV